MALIEFEGAGILVDRVRKVTEGLIDHEQGGFRTERRCVDQIDLYPEADR